MMARNNNLLSKKPKRTVILGSKGFVASAVKKKLTQKKINFISVGKKDIDLINKNSVKKLNSLIKDDDTILFISAKAPVKNYEMFDENIKI